MVLTSKNRNVQHKSIKLISEMRDGVNNIYGGLCHGSVKFINLYQIFRIIYMQNTDQCLGIFVNKI